MSVSVEVQPGGVLIDISSQAELMARVVALETAVADMQANPPQLPSGTEGDLLMFTGGQWVGTDTLPIG